MGSRNLPALVKLDLNDALFLACSCTAGGGGRTIALSVAQLSIAGLFMLTELPPIRGLYRLYSLSIAICVKLLLFPLNDPSRQGVCAKYFRFHKRPVPTEGEDFCFTL
eukprot:1175971-Prorocentrum_minimum.AAC.4